MDGREVESSPENHEVNYWADLFVRLSEIAKNKISDHGRNYGIKHIETKPFRFNDIKLSVKSTDVDRYLIIKMAVSRDNSEEFDYRPVKGINMVWATGVDEAYSDIQFTLWPNGVLARGQSLLGEEKDLRLVNSVKAASDFYSLGYLAIDNSRLPHPM